MSQASIIHLPDGFDAEAEQKQSTNVFDLLSEQERALVRMLAWAAGDIAKRIEDRDLTQPQTFRLHHEHHVVELQIGIIKQPDIVLVEARCKGELLGKVKEPKRGLTAQRLMAIVCLAFDRVCPIRAPGLSLGVAADAGSTVIGSSS